MNPLFDRLSSDFLPRFLGGVVINFEIAGIAIALGLACGLLLAVARLYGGAIGAVAASIIALMRAAPTFVVMFFLLNVIPRNAALFGVPLALSGVPYAAAYIADSGVEALQQLRRGSPLGSLLFLPNVTRAFFVLVMSSSAGAAIGVPEGIAVILRQAEQLPSLGDKLALFAVGIVFFGIPLQAGFAVMTLFQRRLSRAVMRNRQVAAAPRG